MSPMLRSVTTFALVSLFIAGCGVIGSGSDDDDDDRDKVECGYNAQPDGDGDCECVTRYEWCGEGTDDCCAFATNTFRFTVHSAGFLPYKGPDSEEPWDWDGDVPDWLIEALELLGYAVPEAATMAEVLDLVDEYAPQLLEGTVPPDPYIEYWIDDELYDASPTEDNTYEPAWRDTSVVSLRRNETLWVVFVDEDIYYDDEADAVYAEQEDLQWLAGRGALQMPGPYYLFNLRFQVEPVW